jgi:tRNA(Ile)-lysidine synthase
MRRCYNASEMDACATIAEFIARNHLLEKDQPLIVGVSGGADSLCLLDCLHRLGYSLVLAHLDHQLRPESPEEADYCRELAERYAIPHAIETADVRAFADQGRSLEEAARLLRYRFLCRVAKQHRSRTIVTGHTEDDQIETILMHFLRGAGPDGLRGMQASTSLDGWVDVPACRGLTLVRPLLETTRAQTLEYCREQGLTVVQDASNQDTAFFRNRLRLELLPELESYNAGIRRALIRTGLVMSAVAQLQEDLVQEAWPKVVSRVGDSAFLLHIESATSLPLAVQRALIRRMVGELRPTLRDVDFEQVTRGLSFLRCGEKGKHQAVAGGLEMLHMGAFAMLWASGTEVSFPGYPQLRASESATLKPPQMLKLAEGWDLEILSGKLDTLTREHALQVSSKNRVFVDADRVRGRLCVRPWQPGDRIQPLGMQGHTKVAELFTNVGIAEPLRALWPLVVDEEKIIWLAGVRMAHEARLTLDTDRYIEMRLISPEENAGRE